MTDPLLEVFRRELLLRGAGGHRPLNPSTAAKMIQRVRHAVNEWGFDLETFAAGDAKRAQLEADAYLARRLEARVGTHAVNHDIDWLRGLARSLNLPLTFRRPLLPRPRLTRLEEHQVVALLRLWRGRRARRMPLLRDRGAFAFEASAGLRPSELASLDVHDVEVLDVDGRRRVRLHVRHPAKGGDVRRLPLPSWIVSPKRPFGAYYRWRRALRTRERALWVTTGRGGPWRRCEADYLRGRFHEAGVALGFPVSCGRLRHRVGRDLALRHGILFAQRFLGHASPETTATYIEYGDEDLERAHDRDPPRDPFQGDA